jgi:DNA-binding NarL/FixJ family response regulator
LSKNLRTLPTPPSRPQMPPPAPSPKVKVIIVDDLDRVRAGLRAVLELEQDLDIVGEAANGLEAVQLAQRLSPDIVVMDLEMPGLDGFEAARQIKANHLVRGVVVLTIHGDTRSREQAVQSGVDAFVEKGAAIAELVETIRQVWGKVSSTAPAWP